MYSPDGQQIVSGSWDETVRLWNVQTGAPGHILSGHTGVLRSVIFSPCGQWVASGSNDETVRLWDVHSGQCLVVVEDFHGYITGIVWNTTPEGTYFTTGYADKSVRVWKAVEEDGCCRVCLHWSSTHGGLFMSYATIQDAQGLGRINIQLLNQRGAVGEPVPPLSFCGASEKLISMASVVSQLGIPSNQSMSSTSPTANPLGNEPAKSLALGDIFQLAR
ncbi:WD40-repeat-containing domain protein [Gamsiella multidivaricata]|uniref:WD40-repeat-containing domain protein n=1 Tax=Gamsiella multidivaricata TaxID=101098 RepID=UPI00221E4663|nr:WD40-repeat-containing domain protein [Gamsiella multidivaricata]KAI7830685.1 WD40-repeat-containing domain protein [Gamsiella multidivaricata]